MRFKKTLSSLVLALALTSTIGSYAEEKKPVLILLGPPGAGKGSQASLLKEKNHWTHISTGDLLREHVSKNTSLGLKAKGFMEKGELVPDDIILDMLFARVAMPDCQKGYILDGFPRTVAQAQSLENRLSSEKMIVINLEVPDSVLISRIAQRELKEKRTDDNKDVVMNRLSVYQKQTAPLIDFYKAKGRLITLNGDEAEQALFGRVQSVIEKTLNTEKK